MLFLSALLYILICGSDLSHAYDWVGAVYRWASQIGRRTTQYAPSWIQQEPAAVRLGKGGRCVYLVAAFFSFIRGFLAVVWFVRVAPHVTRLFRHPYVYAAMTLLCGPWPLIWFVVFLRSDPGEITERNVNSYLEIYPHDNLIYTPRVCPTTNLPVVPRSRYCRFTHRHIAYPCVLTPVDMITIVHGSLMSLASRTTGGLFCSSGPAFPRARVLASALA